eukprot:5731783-Pleurochrysis_carterae.AAC.1
MHKRDTRRGTEDSPHAVDRQRSSRNKRRHLQQRVTLRARRLVLSDENLSEQSSTTKWTRRPERRRCSSVSLTPSRRASSFETRRMSAEASGMDQGQE